MPPIVYAYRRNPSRDRRCVLQVEACTPGTRASDPGRVDDLAQRANEALANHIAADLPLTANGPRG